MKYRAFISYSHRDTAWADWLHRSVERYRVPRALVGRQTAKGAVPARVLPLFRDREELPAADDLSTVIRAALEQSDHLIVLCSPRSAQSRWVNEEILTFKRLGREDRILALIVDGEPNSPDAAHECFPAALRFRLGADGQLSETPAEPVAADARDVGDGRDNARLKLIAALLGVGLDELKRREMRAQRRRLAFAYALTGLFALLAAASVWFAISAERQRAIAQANLDTGLKSADTLTYGIARKLRDSDGVRKTLLLDVLKPTTALLDGLSANQGLPPSVRLTQTTAFAELADASYQAGQTEEALAATDRGLALSEPQDGDGEIADPLANERVQLLCTRGDALLAQGQLDKAGEALTQAFDIARALAVRHETEPDYARNLFIAAGRPGEVLRARGDVDAALASYRAMGPLIEAYEKHHPGEVEVYRAYAAMHILVGRALAEQAAHEPAIAAFNRSIEAGTRWVAMDKGSSQARINLSMTRLDLANTLFLDGKLDEARYVLKQVLDSAAAMIASDPSNAFVRRVQAFGLMQTAAVEWAAQRPDVAAPLVEQVLAQLAEQAEGESPLWRLYDLSSAWQLRAQIYGSANLVGTRDAMEKALGFAREAIALDPANTGVQERLAEILLFTGDIRRAYVDYKGSREIYDEARTVYETLLALKPAKLVLTKGLVMCLIRLVETERFLGNKDAEAARTTEARALLEKALGQHPADPNLIESKAYLDRIAPQAG